MEHISQTTFLNVFWYRKLESRLLIIFFIVIPDLHIWHMKAELIVYIIPPE